MIICLLHHGNINIKGGTGVQCACCLDNALMILYDLFYNGQAHAGAFRYFLTMQLLKHFKNPFAKVGFKANTVVTKTNMAIIFTGRQWKVFQPAAVYNVAPDCDMRWYAWFRKLH